MVNTNLNFTNFEKATLQEVEFGEMFPLEAHTGSV